MSTGVHRACEGSQGQSTINGAKRKRTGRVSCELISNEPAFIGDKATEKGCAYGGLIKCREIGIPSRRNNTGGVRGINN